MTRISSRTPEGQPHRCPLCGQVAAVEPSHPSGDTVCPSCGALLWWFRDRLGHELELATSFTEDIGSDSLDKLELLMEVEEQFGLSLDESEAEQIKTVADAIRLIRKHSPGEAA